MYKRQLLRRVADRLLSATRGCDTVARLGGDEFAVLLEGVRADADAVTVAERVVAALRPSFAVDGRQAFVGTSVGIARAEAEGGVDALLRDADAAMYRAKARGKGRFVFYADAEAAPAGARLAAAA